MTIAEAKALLGLRETDSADSIKESGLRYILRITNDSLKVWSLSTDMRKGLEKKAEACRTLLDAIRQ